jgi:hypothetical protein
MILNCMLIPYLCLHEVSNQFATNSSNFRVVATISVYIANIHVDVDLAQALSPMAPSSCLP